MKCRTVSSRWMKVSFSPEIIFAWQDVGATVEQAIEARGRGLTPEQWKKEKREEERE